LQLFHAKGCEVCGGTGYKGRIGIIEILKMSDTIRELVLQKASANEIERVAVAEGMHTMFEDGCKKAVEGLTTIEEIVRVTQDD